MKVVINERNDFCVVKMTVEMHDAITGFLRCNEFDNKITEIHYDLLYKFVSIQNIAKLIVLIDAGNSLKFSRN